MPARATGQCGMSWSQRFRESVVGKRARLNDVADHGEPATLELGPDEASGTDDDDEINRCRDCGEREWWHYCRQCDGVQCGKCVVHQQCVHCTSRICYWCTNAHHHSCEDRARPAELQDTNLDNDFATISSDDEQVASGTATPLARQAAHNATDDDAAAEHFWATLDSATSEVAAVASDGRAGGSVSLPPAPTLTVATKTKGATTNADALGSTCDVDAAVPMQQGGAAAGQLRRSDAEGGVDEW